uniref:Uncharacterized protein n=1 Tax=Arundo donax TaxID=35708 RepID=A0A0A8ZJ18_ARUDO
MPLQLPVSPLPQSPSQLARSLHRPKSSSISLAPPPKSLTPASSSHDRPVAAPTTGGTSVSPSASSALALL